MHKQDMETGHGVRNEHRQSDTPEPGRSWKRQWQQVHAEELNTEITQVVRILQPASAPPQLPRERRAAAVKLMQEDGEFTKSECVLVLHFFTSSINIVDSYLAINDKELRTMYIKCFLDSRGSSGCHLPSLSY